MLSDGWGQEERSSSLHYYPTGYAGENPVANPMLRIMEPDSVAKLIASPMSQIYKRQSASQSSPLDSAVSTTRRIVDTRAARSVYLTPQQAEGLHLDFLCTHTSGAFIAGMDGVFAAEHSIPLRWGMEVR
jgi:hypothetical protein